MGKPLLSAALLLLCAAVCFASPLEGLLWSKLSEEQAASLEENATVEKAVKLLSPAQKEEVRSGLSYLEQSEELGTLKEAGKGYLLLGYARDAARVAAKLRELEPTEPRGHALAAQSAYALGDFNEAAQSARRALLLDKKDASIEGSAPARSRESPAPGWAKGRRAGNRGKEGPARGFRVGRRRSLGESPALRPSPRQETAREGG